MKNVELRAPVGIRISFVQQLRLLGWSRRWLFLGLGLLLLLVIVGSTEIDAYLGLPSVLVAAMLGLPAPAIWALVVWHGELPYRRAYHWSLPVPRPEHDLARIAAGAVWLLAAYLGLAAAGAIVAATNGDWERFASIGPAWATFFAGPLVLYFLISPFALWSDSSWLRRGAVVFVGVGFCATILQHEWFRRMGEAVFGQSGGLTTALFVRQAELGSVGSLGQGGTTALWLGIGFVATVVTATWRPADLARLVSGRRAKSTR